MNRASQLLLALMAVSRCRPPRQDTAPAPARPRRTPAHAADHRRLGRRPGPEAAGDRPCPRRWSTRTASTADRLARRRRRPVRRDAEVQRRAGAHARPRADPTDMHDIDKPKNEITAPAEVRRPRVAAPGLPQPRPLHDRGPARPLASRATPASCSATSWASIPRTSPVARLPDVSWTTSARRTWTTCDTAHAMAQRGRHRRGRLHPAAEPGHLHARRRRLGLERIRAGRRYSGGGGK